MATLSITNKIDKLANVDLFQRDRNTGELRTGLFIGRPFYLDYDRAHILVADSWKWKARGIPQGSFLLTYYENEPDVSEAILLRVLRPTKLPTDSDVVSSMVEYYKDNLQTSGSENQLDTFTRFEFSFSGLECRMLGTFYIDDTGRTKFGADVENFYSPHNYRVIKPKPEVLERIANFRDGEITGKPTDVKIGRVRYSSSLRFQEQEDVVPVYVNPQDFLGKRTALFGMTRTGKSNTVKKIIQATASMTEEASYSLDQGVEESGYETLEPFSDNGAPKYPVGQIIFDINGEYANPNMQDEGTAIFEMFQKQTTRYSTIEKPGFKVMKVNFYRDVPSGSELIRNELASDSADYVRSFLSVDLTEPEEGAERNELARYGRKRAAYLCCLHQAGFPPPDNFTISFEGNQQLNALVRSDGSLDPRRGISLEEATAWFETVYDQLDTNQFFATYRNRNDGRDWAGEDLRALLSMLTRKRTPGGNQNLSGYRKLRRITNLHIKSADKPYQVEIIQELRRGRIIIVDLSQGVPDIQKLYSQRICEEIFLDAMGRFGQNQPNNFIQFYFEEAHNLFPKKEDKDLSQIYNRIAKEGAKLNLGLLYATQEVSSISSNVLKNTQNWFISHLNNEDETKELKKYYDFEDFTDSLVRFSARNDKGFVRMKTYSNPFVVPVQIDKFSKYEDEE